MMNDESMTIEETLTTFTVGNIVPPPPLRILIAATTFLMRIMASTGRLNLRQASESCTKGLNHAHFRTATKTDPAGHSSTLCEDRLVILRARSGTP